MHWDDFDRGPNALVRALVLTLLCVGLLANVARADGWRGLERQGDRFWGQKKYDQATDAFMRAIVDGPRPTPQRLWDKHARAYAETAAGKAERQEQAAQKLPGGAPLPLFMAPPAWNPPAAPKDTYAPSELIRASQVHSLATAALSRGRSESEGVRVVAPEYEIADIRFDHVRTGHLDVTGTVRNTGGSTIHNPRVYVTVYDSARNLRGRVWGYVKRGRNVLERGDEKDFEVSFTGFRGTVGYYKAELVARFKPARG